MTEIDHLVRLLALKRPVVDFDYLCNHVQVVKRCSVGFLLENTNSLRCPYQDALLLDTCFNLGAFLNQNTASTCGTQALVKRSDKIVFRSSLLLGNFYFLSIESSHHGVSENLSPDAPFTLGGRPYQHNLVLLKTYDQWEREVFGHVKVFLELSLEEIFVVDHQMIGQACFNLYHVVTFFQ